MFLLRLTLLSHTAALLATAQTVYGPNIIPEASPVISFASSGTIGIFTFTNDSPEAETLVRTGDDYSYVNGLPGDETVVSVDNSASEGSFSGVVAGIEAGRKYLFEVPADHPYSEFYGEPEFTLGGQTISGGTIFIGGSSDASKTLSFQLILQDDPQSNFASFAIRQVL